MVAIIVALLNVNIWVTVLVQKKVHKAVEKIPNAVGQYNLSINRQKQKKVIYFLHMCDFFRTFAPDFEKHAYFNKECT